MPRTSTFWNQFFIIKNFNQYPMLSALLKGYEGESLIGYNYIDHEQGITFDIFKLFEEKEGEFIITKNLIADKSRAILRFEHFAGMYFEIANLNALESLNLEFPDYIRQHERYDLKKFREHEIYQKFAAKGFPDDISVFLSDETGKFKTENIWIRVESFDAEKETGLGTLLVQPFQKLGVNKGDSIIFNLAETQDKELQPFGFIQKRQARESEKTIKTPQEKENKKWWKFW
jgi:hypothetical protein